MVKSIPVLLVDARDSPVEADLAGAERFSLEREASVEAGIEKIRSERFDCVVTAENLPDGDGLELLGRVRAERPELPVVLCAAEGSETVASEAISAGVTDYIRVDPEGAVEGLAERVREAVEGYHDRTAYRELFETIDETIVVHDPESDSVVDMNRQVCDVWDRSYGEACECSVEDLPRASGADSERSAREIVERAIAEGSSRVEWRCDAEDGEQYWADVRLYATQIRGRDRVVALLRDVTAEKRQERQLAETNERYETVLEQSRDGIRIVQDGIVRYVNERFAEMTGYATEELVGRSSELTVAPEYRDLVGRHHVARVNDEAPPNQYEFDVETSDGERRRVEASVSKIRYDGAPASLSILRDITERKERERELERQNERLEEFASAVSHDLRNPLSVAGGHLTLLAEECDSEHVDRARGSIERMEMLIEDLLTLAREGRRVDPDGDVDLAATARESWGFVSTRDATLDVDTDLTFEADRNRLGQLLENLFRNAVEHAGADVTVRVADRPDGGFYVEDDGPGIPPDEREDVFEAGFTTSTDGTGFGLAIVDEIAAAHGWTVRATAGTDGGARFEFTDIDVGDESVE